MRQTERERAEVITALQHYSTTYSHKKYIVLEPHTDGEREREREREIETRRQSEGERMRQTD